MSLFDKAKNLFPHPSLKPQQENLLRDVCEALVQRKKLILISAPPGFGKTDVVLSSIRAYNPKRVYYIVPTKALQEQIGEAFSRHYIVKEVVEKSRKKFFCKERNDVFTVKYRPPIIPALPKGGDAYTCLIQPNHSVEESMDKNLCKKCPHRPTRVYRHNQIVKGAVKGNKGWLNPAGSSTCLYWVARLHAITSPYSVMTYRYYFNDVIGPQDLPLPQIIVLDEIHNLERILVEVNTLEIEGRLISRHHISFTNQDPICYLINILQDALLVKRVLEKRCRESPTNTLNSSKEELKRIIGTLKRIIKERGRYRVFVDEEAGIQALPIDLPYLFNAAFEYVPTIIGISSTIGSLEYWRNVTGLPYDDIVMISAPPTIPKANRPFYVLEDGVALSEDELKNPETIQRVLEIITKLLKVPCNIIIHPHTIEIGRKIASQLMKLDGFKERVITHTPLLDGFGDSYYTSEEAVERFKRRGGILVSTVVKEGQDFPYDKARLQIIVKMPFPDITAPYVNAMKEKYGEEWYNWQVVRDLEQAYGRIVRAEDDWGVTVCVDTNFRWFFGKNLKSFDRWFTEAVRSATTDEVVATLQKRLGKC